jgi:hypothetical protein
VAPGMPKLEAIARFSFALRLSSLSAAGKFQSRFPHTFSEPSDCNLRGLDAQRGECVSRSVYAPVTAV